MTVDQRRKVGEHVTITVGADRIEHAGTVTDAGRYGCYVQVEGFDKPTFRFNEEIRDGAMVEHEWQEEPNPDVRRRRMVCVACKVTYRPAVEKEPEGPCEGERA